MTIDDDQSIPASDGTQWLYYARWDIWNGWMPGEDGLWELSPDEMARSYPEVRCVPGQPPTDMQ